MSLWEEKRPIPLGELNLRLHQGVLVKRHDSIIDEYRVRGGLNISEKLSAVKAGLKKEAPGSV